MSRMTRELSHKAEHQQVSLPCTLRLEHCGHSTSSERLGEGVRTSTASLGRGVKWLLLAPKLNRLFFSAWKREWRGGISGVYKAAKDTDKCPAAALHLMLLPEVCSVRTGGGRTRAWVDIWLRSLWHLLSSYLLLPSQVWLFQWCMGGNTPGCG